MADGYVNPVSGSLDGLAVVASAGWGVLQLPPEDYPAEVASALLGEVAEHAEEFWRRGYDVVLIGEPGDLAAALERLGMPLPDSITPSSADELRSFLDSRPEPEAARLLG